MAVQCHLKCRSSGKLFRHQILAISMRFSIYILTPSKLNKFVEVLGLTKCLFDFEGQIDHPLYGCSKMHVLPATNVYPCFSGG